MRRCGFGWHIWRKFFEAEFCGGRSVICLSKNKQGPDLLIGHLEGTLDAAQSAELQRHAQECAECRGLLGVWNQMGEFPAPEVSRDFDARLYAKIAAA